MTDLLSGDPRAIDEERVVRPLRSEVGQALTDFFKRMPVDERLAKGPRGSELTNS